MSFRDLLTESLRVLRDEAPAAHEAMRRALGPREVRLCVDGDDFALRFAGDDVLVDVPQHPVLEVQTDRRGVLALVDGTHTLLSAVFADILLIQGDLDDLLAFHDGLLAYLHGAVRAPSFPPLLAGYRAGQGGPPP